MKTVTFLSLLCPLCVIHHRHLTSEAFVTGHSGLVSTTTTTPGGRTTSARTKPTQRQTTSIFVSRLEQSLKQISGTLDAASDATSSPSLVPKLKEAVRPQVSPRELGLLVLLTVPIAWGTYACTVQSIYALEPQVPGFLFSTCYFFVAAMGSLAATTFVNSRRQSESSSSNRAARIANQNKEDMAQPVAIPAMAGLELGFYVYLANFLHVIGLQSVPSDRAGFLFQLTTVMVPMLEALFARNLFAIAPSTWIACALAMTGIWVMGMDWPFEKFQAQVAPTATAAMQSMEEMSSYVADDTALDMSNAAATAVEPTSLLVDSSILQQQDLTQALADSSNVVLDSTNSLVDTLLSGESLIIGAAFLYALQILRISKWTAVYSPLQIMTGKTVAESLLSLVFVGSTTLLATSGMDVSNANGAVQYLHNCGQQTIDFAQSVSRGLAEGTLPLDTVEHFTGACLWTGLVTTCYLVFAQSYGQQHVKASDANLIYSLQPIFTAIFAYYLLGETLEPMGFVGGAFIGAGVLLVASKSLVAKA